MYHLFNYSSFKEQNKNRQRNSLSSKLLDPHYRLRKHLPPQYVLLLFICRENYSHFQSGKTLFYCTLLLSSRAVKLHHSSDNHIELLSSLTTLGRRDCFKIQTEQQVWQTSQSGLLAKVQSRPKPLLVFSRYPRIDSGYLIFLNYLSIYYWQKRVLRNKFRYVFNIFYDLKIVTVIRSRLRLNIPKSSTSI